jgi:ATP-dependent DNA helicase RecG
MLRLDDPLTPTLLRTTEQFIDALESIGIETVQDLILMLPRAHEDLSQVRTLDDVEEGEKVLLRGVVSDLKVIRTRKQRKFLVQAVFTDANGNQCQIVFFNQPHIARMLPQDMELVLTGKIRTVRGKLTLQSPTFERGDRTELLHAGRLVAVYAQPTAAGGQILSTRWFREKMALVRPAMRQLPETLPADIVRSENLLSRAQAIEQMHFPESGEKLMKAQARMDFEELFELQRAALERKMQWQEEAEKRLAIPMNPELIRAFFRSLHFTPTNSQKIAIYEILKDLEKTVPMSRLLEGDVGSGKTLVAVAVMANVLTTGGQCALMVPTEVLAKQHAENITKLLLNFHQFLLTDRTYNLKPTT